MDLIEELIKQGKKAWIQEKNKAELIAIANKQSQEIIFDESSSVEEIRKYLREYVDKVKTKGCSRGTIMNAISSLEVFTGENWSAYQQQFECFLLLNEINQDKKVPLLITKLSTKVYELLTTLCIPETPLNQTYEKLCEKLTKYYHPGKNNALHQAEFRKRCQKQNESIEQYIIELKRLSKNCNFRNFDDEIKERLLNGTFCDSIRFELLKQADKSLQQLTHIGKTAEIAYKLAFHPENKEREQPQIFKLKGEQYNKKNRSVRSNTPMSKQNGSCFCCGKDGHLKAECYLREKFCSECGVKGHIFKVCKKNPRSQRTYLVEEENETKSQSNKEVEEDYEEAVVNLFSVSRVPPHYITLNIEGQPLDFLLDTGSDVTVIPQRIHSKFLQNLQIHKSNVQFRNFDQSLSKPIGLLKAVKVGLNDKTKKLSLYVACDDVPLILGRDWLKTLDLWPPKFYETNVIVQDRSNNIKTVSEAENIIKEKFAEVFNSKFGRFEGEEIKLKLKPEAKPKFLPVRRVPYALKDKVKLEINRLLKNGRITPVEHSQWGTPVVPIQKPDGSIRLCGDYKLTLNPHLEVDHFPLPHIEEILDTLKNGEYFCELDLKEAYLQARLDKESQEMTTIVTEIGTLHSSPL